MTTDQLVVTHRYGLKPVPALAQKIGDLAERVLAVAASRGGLTPDQEEEHRTDLRKFMTFYCACGSADCAIAGAYAYALVDGIRIGSLVGIGRALHDQGGSLPKVKTIEIKRSADGSSLATIWETA
jgi:hypothetical protein